MHLPTEVFSSLQYSSTVENAYTGIDTIKIEWDHILHTIGEYDRNIEPSFLPLSRRVQSPARGAEEDETRDGPASSIS